MPRYDERIEPYASLSDSMDSTHMSEEAKSKLSNLLSSMFTDTSSKETNSQGFK